MAPFYGWGSTASRLELLWGGSLLFTTKSPEILRTHFIDLGQNAEWTLEPPSGFEHRNFWIGNPAPKPLGYCFTLKALFVLKLFNFLSWSFGHVEKWMIRIIKLISKCMTSQPRKQVNAIHILSNISSSKGNWTIKFDQLIE